MTISFTQPTDIIQKPTFWKFSGLMDLCMFLPNKFYSMDAIVQITMDFEIHCLFNELNRKINIG